MAKPILCLRELSLFEGLSENDFYSICPGTVNKSITKGQYLFRQGEHDHAVYLIKAGKLKLIQNTEDGREVIINIAGPGEVLGETALFQEHSSPFSAVALENVRACCFNRQGFELIIRQNPSFAIKIISYLSGKLHSTMLQVGESSGSTVREKLLRLFVRLAAEHGRESANTTIIELKITQQEMGNMIGASRVKVSQVLKELKDKGIIGRHGKYYTIKTDFCLKHFS